MKTTKIIGSLALVVLGGVSQAASFSDNFDVDTSASWAVNKGATNGANNIATFAYDYSALGIPSASGIGGTTKGLRMQANIAGGVFGGLSASPLGQSFNGDIVFTVDVWMNFLGPAPAGGSGSTQAGGMGIGTAGTTVQWAGGAQDSIHFSGTLDGNSSADYRAYSSAAAVGYADASTVFAASGAGNRNDSHAYYQSLGSKTAPAAQTTLFPTQTGTTRAGALGFAWRKMKIERVGTMVSWYIDSLRIATVDQSTVTLGGNNILLNMYDTNPGSATDPNGLNTIIFDNVQVVPEPTSMVALALGGAALLRKRRK